MAAPTDAAAKSGLLFAFVLGAVIGALVGAPRYGLFHISTVNVMGLFVIATVFLWTGIVLLRARRTEPTSK
jgi:hypothetical protein